MSAGTRCSASHPILAIRSCFNFEGYSVGVVLCFIGFGPPLQSQAGHANSRRFPSGNGGERAQQLSFRSHDANFGLSDLDPLGEGAQVIPPITVPVEPDALPGHVGEPAHGGGRHRPIAGAFEHGLRPLGIDLRLVAKRLQTRDTVFQRGVTRLRTY